MSEKEVQEEAVESEEIEDTEALDEELWSQDEEAEGDSESEGTPQEESEEKSEDKEEPEDTEDETEDEEPEEPQHDYEARYKDLEKEFHKRNEESARLRENFDELRLRDVEREQAFDRVRRGLPETEAPPIDPTDPDAIFNKDDKQTMEEFSELSSTFRKMIQHEMAKQGTTMQEATVQAQQRLTQLEDQTKEQNYQNFLHYHENYMNENVGEDYRDIDKDADFQAFVLGSPAMTKMMTESTDPIDHASVMQLFLSTEVGESEWRPPEEEVKQAKASTKRQAKRAAATGLLGNSAPVKSKNMDNLSDDELWEAIPE
ncbi:uncharacterized protein METZ01_LOCUS222564 [marine metagenome]|uniref:Uncharacterized protein n=1 Tax=marine metagenome TaxID=408172 RepID=A0A382G376_9ZZZZ